MDAADGSFFHLMPISVSSECQILMQNNDELRRCQLDAFDAWVRPWQNVPRTQLMPAEHADLPLKNSCCYRWSLLDCLTDSVQHYCPNAASFDLRVFLAKRDQVVLYYETFQCEDYPFGALACHLSIWTFLLLLFCLLALLSLVVFLIFYNVRFHAKKVRNSKAENVTDL